MAAEGIRRGECLGVGKSQGLILNRPFWLFCAGEDSGDILGEAVVREISEKGLGTIGSGGARMQSAGLRPVFSFDDLPVNGFFDVLLHGKKLRRNFSILKKLLQDRNCRGLVAVDYPGFNLGLMELALKLDKRVIYVEPPQIWAWKPKRIRKFLTPKARSNVEIRAMFDVECEAYRKYGLHVKKIPHPFDSVSKNAFPLPRENIVLLYPGSRLAQIRRNLRLYLQIACKLKEKKLSVRFIASRDFTEKFLRQNLSIDFPVFLSPKSAEERFVLLSQAKLVVAAPGSAVVEAFKAKTFCVAASRIDPLTYILGKFFIRTKYLTIPNIERERCGKPSVVCELVKSSLADCESHASDVLRIFDAQLQVPFKT